MTPAGGFDRRAFAGIALAAMLALSLLAGVTGRVPGWLPGACAWLGGALLLRDIGRYQRLQILLMCGMGIACIAFASLRDNFAWTAPLAAGNHTLLAMLAAVSFLRLLARDVDVNGAALPRGPRAVRSTVIASHLFGAVINISAPLVIGDRIAQQRRLTPLQAKALSRPFTAAAMWSPFFAAMALVVQYVPGASMPVMSAAGFCVAMVMVTYCAITLPREPEAADFRGFPLKLEALRLPLALGLLVLIGHLGLPSLPTLTLIALAALTTVLGFSLARSGRSSLAALREHVLLRLPEMSGELTLFLAAAVMAAGIDAAAHASGFALTIARFDTTAAALLLAALIALAMVGVHVVVSLSALASVWNLGAADPSLVGLVFLLAWGLGLVVSPFSGTTLALQGRFGMRSVDFVRWNVGYALVGYLVSIVALYAMGRLA